MGWQVSFPANEVLFLLPVTKGPFLEDLLHFPFWFTFYDVRWWFDKVGAVYVGFFI